jgi:hypothetical protein
VGLGRETNGHLSRDAAQKGPRRRVDEGQALMPPKNEALFGARSPISIVPHWLHFHCQRPVTPAAVNTRIRPDADNLKAGLWRSPYCCAYLPRMIASGRRLFL